MEVWVQDFHAARDDEGQLLGLVKIPFDAFSSCFRFVLSDNVGICLDILLTWFHASASCVALSHCPETEAAIGTTQNLLSALMITFLSSTHFRAKPRDTCTIESQSEQRSRYVEADDTAISLLFY